MPTIYEGGLVGNTKVSKELNEILAVCYTPGHLSVFGFQTSAGDVQSIVTERSPTGNTLHLTFDNLKVYNLNLEKFQGKNIVSGRDSGR
jgi:hypothetical protein